MTLLLWLLIVLVQEDPYGGSLSVAATPTGKWHFEQIRGRWWLVTPDGHGTFIRAVSGVNTSDWGGSGGFRAYEAVYLESAGVVSANLKSEAESTITRDAVHPATAVTLSAVGDTIHFGADLKPNTTYFWLDRLGVGGKVAWYYLSGSGWKLINGTGKPSSAAALNADGSCYLDVGNYMAPDANGFGAWGNTRANRITWWSAFPADFVRAGVPMDPSARYWIKGVVTQAYTTAPILNQAFERASLGEAILKKYGTYTAWAQAMGDRMRGWGFNATGQYSYRYWSEQGAVTNRLPMEPTWQLSDWAMRASMPYKVKSVYADAVFPPASGSLVWQGLQADVFEPGFTTALMTETASRLPMGIWNFGVVPEEGDTLFGINKLSHDHLGYIQYR